MIPNQTPQTATAEVLLGFNRAHWSCERAHRIFVDTAIWDVDRCWIRSGLGPVAMDCLRRLAFGLILARNKPVAETMAILASKSHLVLDLHTATLALCRLAGWRYRITVV